jgi:hypothetical protein
MESDCFLRTREAASFLNVSPQFLEASRRRGDGPPFVKWRMTVRYRRSALDAWMRAKERVSETMEASGAVQKSGTCQSAPTSFC